MNMFSSVSNEMLINRLNEIDGDLQDWHISGYRANLLIEESNNIKSELRSRGFVY